jgi:predicted acyl esterase
VVRTEFPYVVETVDPLWIALADGTRIAATLWRPLTDAKVPVVVETVPYRRRDGTVARDMDMQPWMAGHGIAYARIDIRGSGDSGGDLADEYSPREQQDACEIIAHLAAQSWCNGNVGMTGISWGGFASLQVAAKSPPALKAIIAHCASDDRYSDDIHYMGGALLTEQEMWSNFMLVKKAMAPDPQVVGPAWREMWERRLNATQSFSEIWLAHQRRDSYWKQGSVCEDFSAIRCAVMAVCGWDDSYSNFVPRLLESLSCPKLGIVGPWSHSYPCRGAPGPLIGYLQEALRWWRQWLCGEETGIMAEPLYRVWITGEERPRPFYEPDHAGSWAAENAWPSLRIQRRFFSLGDRTLDDLVPGGVAKGFTPTPNPSPQGGGGSGARSATNLPPASTGFAQMSALESPSPLWGGVRGGGTDLDETNDATSSIDSDASPHRASSPTMLSVCSPATAGRDCGRWGGYGGACPDMPIDQRREDAIALCFDTPPLDSDTTLLGAVELDLLVRVDQPHVNLAARLCDVYPDGTSALMTYGVLNLSHRDSHEHPSPCPVGTPFRLRLKLNDFGRTVPAGHRIRLALANQHWPILWPQPKLSTLSVATGESTIALPVRPPSERDRAVRFEPAETAPPVPETEFSAAFDRRTVTDDVGSGVQTIALVSDHGRRRYDDRGITTASMNADTFVIRADDPLSARLSTMYRWAIASGEADTESVAYTEFTADETHFHLSWRLEARERGRLVHSASATRRIRRDFA